MTAIKGGQVKSSLVKDTNADVLLFDSATIIPKDTGVFDPSQDQTRRSQWWGALKPHREQFFSQLQQFAIQQGVPAGDCYSVTAINSLDTAKLRLILAEPSKAEEVENAIKLQIKLLGAQVCQQSYNNIGDEYWRKAAPKVQLVFPENFLVSTESKFFQNEHFLWGDVDPFQQAFGRVFATYRELIHSNDRLEKYPPKNDPKRRFLNISQFENEYGPPPWEFVNQILEECNLDFRVDRPPLDENTSYEAMLHKISSHVEMRFQDLSSGEKVLMSFALCLYNSQDSRHSKIFPKLLLLDEVDAPLHPSMVMSLLKTIQNVLVRDKNVAVILSTHSPSTVALAEEGSIYSMNPKGPQIEKVSKAYALSLLTAGVPTLSVSFDGRRQVFVESRTDANLYDSLYQRYKSHLSSERSLVFVEVGRKDASGGEKNAGCDQVKRLVKDLTEGGNQSVFGLVDWDGKSEQDGRIHVLSQGKRDGLESLLFDPVLLIAMIGRENLKIAIEKNIFDQGESYLSISSWDSSRWQRGVETVQNMIMHPSASQRETIDVTYLNDMTLKIAKEYLHLDDHALEKKIIDVFSFLKPINNRAGGLMQFVVDDVLNDHQSLLPKDLLGTLSSLLSVDVGSSELTTQLTSPLTPQAPPPQH